MGELCVGGALCEGSETREGGGMSSEQQVLLSLRVQQAFQSLQMKLLQVLQVQVQINILYPGRGRAEASIQPKRVYKIDRVQRGRPALEKVGGVGEDAGSTAGSASAGGSARSGRGCGRRTAGSSAFFCTS